MKLYKKIASLLAVAALAAVLMPAWLLPATPSRPA